MRLLWHDSRTSVQYVEERKITHNIVHSSNNQYTILHCRTIQYMWAHMEQVPTLALWHTAYGVLDKLEK